MKFLKLLAIILIIPILCSCSSKKTPISSTEFIEKMISFDLEAKEVKPRPVYAKSAYIVNDTISLYYIEGYRRYDIEGLFVDECANILQGANKGYKKKTSGGDNWTKMTVDDDKYYYYIIWVDKTYIYGKTTIKNKAKLNNVMKSLGY